MIYSFVYNQWEMGCFTGFGDPERRAAHKTILNRFTSWALSAEGVVGFWGKMKDGGLLVQKNSKASGQAIFLDPVRRTLITAEGEKRLSGTFHFLREDATLIDRVPTMKREELLSFLLNRTTYFDFSGISVPIRQIVQQITGEFQGYRTPVEKAEKQEEVSTSASPDLPLE